MKWTLALVLSAFAVSAQEQAPSERFYQAIRNDDLPTLRALVDTLGANTKDSLGQTPLMIAAAFGSTEAVELLIAGGADVKAVSRSGVTALHWSLREAKTARLLLDGGADVNARTSIGRTPLLVAASTTGTADVVGLLLDKGADINAADTTGVTPLIAAASVDEADVVTLLLAKGAAINAKASVGQSATALMGAAYNGSVELVRQLLARKAELEAVSADKSGTVKNGPVQFGNVTALHMATASGSADLVQMLLEAGAQVDPLDVRGMTPLMWSVSTDRPQPRLVRMLLDSGADRRTKSNLGETAEDWARKFNNPVVLAELRLKPVEAASPPTMPAAIGTTVSPREAVERSMPLLRDASAKMLTAGGCVACHAQPVTVMAVDLASARAWRVERSGPESAQVLATITAAAQPLLQAREGGGLPDTQVYNAITMAAQKAPPSFATDALVHYLAAKQRPEGNWHGIGATRAPIQDGDFSRTAMSIRTLAVYGTPARRVELAQRVERAAAWLASQSPLTTEDRVMQLLGLKWASANPKVRDTRTRELIATQRSDGGWAQTSHLTSDAYATGQALYTLRELGVLAGDAALQRGAMFLLRTQLADGSWHVKSRAMKIQPYFESGFPHGHDQWISQTGTAWAVMALSQVASEQRVVTAAAAVR